MFEGNSAYIQQLEIPRSLLCCQLISCGTTSKAVMPRHPLASISFIEDRHVLGVVDLTLSGDLVDWI